MTHPAFRGIGSAFLVLDMALFISFSTITIARYCLYPVFFRTMLKNETHSLFTGTIPMGCAWLPLAFYERPDLTRLRRFVTIVSGIARTGTEYGIDGALDVAIVLWWIAFGG